MEKRDHLARYGCLSCGAELRPWFTADDAAENDDDAFNRWLDTPCPNCATTPR